MTRQGLTLLAAAFLALSGCTYDDTTKPTQLVSASVTAGGIDQWQVGDRVRTTQVAGVRSAPNGSLLGYQGKGMVGTVLQSPGVDPFGSGTVWWQVNFDTYAPDGWVTNDYLTNEIRPGFYAAPWGLPGNIGTFASPWDLATAIDGAHGVGAGDTIWLRGGTYSGGPWISDVQGNAGAQVVIRALPGERAILDGVGVAETGEVLRIRGAFSTLWGIEVTNSDPDRIFTDAAQHRPNAVWNTASHTKYINLVIHDGGVAFLTENHEDVEIAGSTIYNTGYQGSDRGHGHALYLKNPSPTGASVLARENIMFNQFGFGVHAFSDPGYELENIFLRGNVSFNSGTLSNNSVSANILVGGDSYATGDSLHENMTYFHQDLASNVARRNVQVGYGSLNNGRVLLRNNYFVGGDTVLLVGYWDSVAVRTNKLVGKDVMVALMEQSTAGHYWSDPFGQNPNRFYTLSSNQAAWTWAGTIYSSLSTWNNVSGLISRLAGAGLQHLQSQLTTTVFVRATPYEPGRANIVVYNWQNQPSVTVNLSSILPVGARFQIRNVQDTLPLPPVVSGSYAGGNVTIPITAATPPVPVGLQSSPSPPTGIAFNVYVLTMTQ